MKRIYSFMFAAVAAFAAASCAQELDNQVPAGETKVYTASVDGAETKAVLDGRSTNWENNDAILIYDGAAAAKYVTSLEAPSSTASFSLEDEKALTGNKVIAVYPEWADGYKSSVADIQKKTLSKAYLTPEQNAKVGTYDPNTAIAMAYSEDNHLEFKNATALLKFTVSTENVKAVTLYSLGFEKLTGEWAIDYNDGQPKATPAEGDASAHWVQLSAGQGVFEVGKEYYISVYPQTLASGFAVEFSFEGVNGKQLVKKVEKSVEFKRNVILNIGNYEFTGTIVPEEPEIPTVDYWAVVGTMTDIWNSEIKMTLEGDWYVVENVKLTNADKFKFRANGNWNDGTPNRGAEGGSEVVCISEGVDTKVVQGGKDMCVALDGIYSMHLHKNAETAKVVKTGDIVVEEPDVTTPGEDSEWAVYAQFGTETWTEVLMETTSREGLFVLKNKSMSAYNKLLIKKYNDSEWTVKYGSYDVNYIKANHYFTAALNGGDIFVEASDSYDIYFDLLKTKIYLMKAGVDYTTAVEQTESGEAPVIEKGTKLYLKPNTNWMQSNARFAVYTWDGGDQWFDMKATNETGVYEVLIPEGISNIIFCRMNPNASANGWGNKWNQTADLKVPTNGTNLYTVKAGTWDKGGGTWSKK